MSGCDVRATQRSAPMMWWYGSLTLEGGVISTRSRLQPAGREEERGFKIFELEVLMKFLLEKLDVVEMSNKNQVINIDGEDNSVISCVEAKCTVHLIFIGLVTLAWLMIAIDIWISRCRFKAQTQEVLVSRPEVLA